MKERWIFSLIVLTSCAVGPKYTSPETDVGQQWVERPEEGEIAGDAPLIQWWESFRDPLLTTFVDAAVKNNNDIHAATSRILQARALRQIAASAFFPAVNADINATKTYFSKNGPIFAIGPSTGTETGDVSPQTGLPFSLQAPQKQNLFNLLLDASWEIDLFGKTRRAVEAADARIGSEVEKRRDLLVSIIAEVANSYILLRTAQAEKEIKAARLNMLKMQASLTSAQLAAGYRAKMETEEREALVLQLQGEIPLIEAEIAREMYALALLVGEMPEAVVEKLETVAILPSLPEEVALGIRSELLQRRPDIRVKERELAAAVAEVGVATAALFPSLVLVGDGGLQSLVFNKLFDWGSKTWAIGGNLGTPIFQGGKLRANLRAKKEEVDVRLAEYKQVVLKALEEAESAIASYKATRVSLEEMIRMNERYVTIAYLSSEKREKGLTSELPKIESELTLNTADEQVLKSKRDSLTALVHLYKVLGGGWENASF